MIWLDRAVKIEGGVLMLSRKGVHDDWDCGLADNPAVGVSAPSFDVRSRLPRLTAVALSGGLLFMNDQHGNVWFMTGDPFDEKTLIAPVPEFVI